MKNLYCLILMLSVSILFSACFPDGSETVQTENIDNKAQIQNVDSYEFNDDSFDDNLMVKPKIIYSENTSYSDMNFTLKKWDENLIEKAFYSNKDIASISEYPSDYDNTRIFTVVEFDDNSSLGYENGFIYYYSDDCSLYDYSLLVDCIQSDDNSEYFSQVELENVDLEKSRQTIDNIIETLEIEYLCEPQIYSMEYSQMNELIKASGLYELNDIKGTENYIWTEKQNAYAFLYSAQMNELKMNEYGSNSKLTGEACEGIYVNGVVQNDKLIYLSISLMPEITEVSEENDICTAEYAIQKALENYKDLVLVNPVEITECRLLYTPFAIDYGKEYVLKPYWQISTFETADGYKYYDNILIDAVTGETYY